MSSSKIAFMYFSPISQSKCCIHPLFRKHIKYQPINELDYPTYNLYHLQPLPEQFFISWIFWGGKIMNKCPQSPFYIWSCKQPLASWIQQMVEKWNCIHVSPICTDWYKGDMEQLPFHFSQKQNIKFKPLPLKRNSYILPHLMIYTDSISPQLLTLGNDFAKTFCLSQCCLCFIPLVYECHCFPTEKYTKV